MDLSEPPRGSGRLARRREELTRLARRSKEVLLLAAVVGVVTGAIVAVFDTAVVESLDAVNEAPLVVVAFAPLVGLALAALALRWLGSGVSPQTSDEYLAAFHDPDHRLGGRALVARMVAAVATLGSGGPMGLEGPSLYAGASVGQLLQRRFPRLFSAGNQRVLLVAGAAAGVGAIFKAPATGAVFALEVPYQDDLARRMLLPALVSSASGYLVFVAIHGTDPLLRVVGAPPFTFKDLTAAAVLGLFAGLGARAFAWLLRHAKQVASAAPWFVRVPAAGGAIALLFGAGRALTGMNLVTGTGYDTIRWALSPSRTLWLVGSILVLRCVATSATVAGGGVGGLFVPLVVAGALAGRFVGGAFNELDTSLFTVVGVAAFLGAGYRVPLAGVMFVAEATGRPGFVVPGLIAAVVAELMMGRASVASNQLAVTGAPDAAAA
jgi:CIC family chloride channel protein